MLDSFFFILQPQHPEKKKRNIIYNFYQRIFHIENKLISTLKFCVKKHCFVIYFLTLSEKILHKSTFEMSVEDVIFFVYLEPHPQHLCDMNPASLEMHNY